MCFCVMTTCVKQNIPCGHEKLPQKINRLFFSTSNKKAKISCNVYCVASRVQWTQSTSWCTRLPPRGNTCSSTAHYLRSFSLKMFSHLAKRCTSLFFRFRLLTFKLQGANLKRAFFSRLVRFRWFSTFTVFYYLAWNLNERKCSGRC